MKVKKRKKSIRFLGSRNYARGYKNRARGSGNRGGVGLSGTGKRGDQKKTLMLNLHGNSYFQKDKSTAKKRTDSVTLDNIAENIHNLVKKGTAKEQKGAYELDFKKFKLIGSRALDVKLKIHVKGASKGARASVEKAGGEIVLPSAK